MKIGMIFECGPQGADRKVCEYLAKQIKPDLEIESVTLDNKQKLIIDCGQAAAQLLTDGCHRVLIIWDLYPSWQREEAPCRKEDREAIERSLNIAAADKEKVALVCIEEELEAWLLADHRAVSAVLSKPHRKVNIKRQRSPERHNPKKRMNRLFNENLGRPYIDRVYAEQIVKAMPDLNRLKKVETFRRFASQLVNFER